MHDGVSWLAVHKEREADILAALKGARHGGRRDGRLPARSFASFRALLGGTLMRLGESIGGCQAEPGRCLPQS